MRKLIRGLRPNEERFRQVQEGIRQESEGALPASWYGRRDILKKDRWTKVIDKYNPKELMETLDKLEGKARLASAGVRLPETFIIMEFEEDLLRFSKWLDGWGAGFALKPSGGHGGAGILVIDRKVAGSFIKSSGKTIEKKTIIEHASKIMTGAYAGEGLKDRAFAEERIVLSKRLRELLTPGLLDIRIVCLKGFPLMAMTRLPTERSGGRANIHQGAIGAGISISEGRIISATYLRRSIKRHPNSGRMLVGFKFNMWDEVLETASLSADASGLGYVGVDLTVDDRKGVVVIEVNKRPGLEIQNANRSGLHKRIRWVERSVRRMKVDPSSLGPGIKAELSRGWDSQGWAKKRVQPEVLEE